MTPRNIVEPPFNSARQAMAFALVLAAFLSLPWVLTKSGLITRRHVWGAAPVKWGGFAYIQRQIQEETSDIDMLVLGTSTLYQGVDSTYLEETLGKVLGRPARVVTFATNWRCELQNYLLLRDVLAHRKVRMLVYSMPLYTQHESLPHLQSHRWMLAGESDLELERLGPKYEFAAYAASTLGTPRHLISLLRPEMPEPGPGWLIGSGELLLRADESGTVKVEQGLMPDPFARWTPAALRLPARSMIYSQSTRGDFRFTGQALNEFQMHFLRLSFRLLARHGVAVALLHVPLWNHRHNPVVEERLAWPDVFGRELKLIGVPEAKMFAGMTEEHVRRFYYTTREVIFEHLNRNGNEYFTRTIAPALLEIYAEHLSKHP